MSQSETSATPSLTGYRIDAAQNIIVNSNRSEAYEIFQINDSYFALNRTTGAMDIQSTDPGTVIQYAINNANGKNVVLGPGTYNLGQSLQLPSLTSLTGAGFGISILMTPTNAPAVILSGHQAILQNLSVWSDQADYISSAIQLLDATECSLFNISLYDFSHFVGNAIEIRNTGGGNSGSDCFANVFNNINVFGFLNGIMVIIDNTGNGVDGNSFNQCIFSSCASVYQTNVAAATTNDNTMFSLCVFQNNPDNPFVTPIFNFDDTASHNNTNIIGSTIFGAGGGVLPYALNSTSELGLIGVYPNADANIGGSGGASMLAAGKITRAYSPNLTEVLTQKTISSSSNTITLVSPFTIGTKIVLDETGLTGARSFEFPDTSDTIVTLTANQAMTNKELTDPKITNVNTGSTTALLAANNCPATTGTAPYAWMTFKSSDGSTVYVPAWK